MSAQLILKKQLRLDNFTKRLARLDTFTNWNQKNIYIYIYIVEDGRMFSLQSKIIFLPDTSQKCKSRFKIFIFALCQFLWQVNFRWYILIWIWNKMSKESKNNMTIRFYKRENLIMFNKVENVDVITILWMKKNRFCLNSFRSKCNVYAQNSRVNSFVLDVTQDNCV